VADVVKESGSQRLARRALRKPVARRQIALHRAQALDEAIHHVSASDCVCESCVLGPGEGKGSDAKLADAPEALHLGSGEQANHDRIFDRIERNQPVDGVAQDHVETSNSDVGSASSPVAKEVSVNATVPSTK
jgi:hypothetical protein